MERPNKQNQNFIHQQHCLSDQSESQSSSDDSDEVQQRPAFSIIQQQVLLQMRKSKPMQEDNQQNQQNDNNQDLELDQDERQAFLYLHSVRKQKKVLMKEKKLRKKQLLTIQTVEQQEQKIVDPQSKNEKINENQQKLLTDYKNCVLQNFNAVVQNVKYLIKTKPQYAHNNKRFNVRLYQNIKLQNEPKIYELIKLTVGQIQQAIRKLSLEVVLGNKKKKVSNQQNEQHKQETKQVQNNKQQGYKKYSLWIYSLLALHQGWSSYVHFESVAQINYVVQKQIQNLSKLNKQQLKNTLLLLIIMVNVFEQRHLNKYIIRLIQDRPDN